MVCPVRIMVFNGATTFQVFLNHKLVSPSHVSMDALYLNFFDIPLWNHCISKPDDPPLAIYGCELFWVHQQSSSIFSHRPQWSLSNFMISIPKTINWSSPYLLNVTKKRGLVYANVQSYLQGGNYSYNSWWHPNQQKSSCHSPPSRPGVDPQGGNHKPMIYNYLSYLDDIWFVTNLVYHET